MPIDFIGPLRDINIVSVTLRLLMAAVFGGLIGLERGSKQRAAGLRTHMLLTMGSATTMLVSQYLYAIYQVGDPARLSAQVISGIGFLGAGSIIVTRRNQIKGLTSAATLWATAAMGLAIGIGFYECAVILFVFLMIVLLFVSVLDTGYLKVEHSSAVYLELDRSSGLGDVIAYIHDVGWKVRDVREYPSPSPDILAVRIDMETERAQRGDIRRLEQISRLDCVRRAEM